MDAETAAGLTDAILAVVTVALAVVLARAPGRRSWAVLFALMTVSATLGAFYHGFDRMRTDRLWVVISGLALATGPAFFRACVAGAGSTWERRSRSWPWWAVAAFVGGAAIAHLRFLWVSILAGACVVLAAACIVRTERRTYRNFVYAGVLTTAVGAVAQATLTGDGLLSGNAVFHLIQIVANLLFFRAALSLPAITTPR